MEFEAGKRYWLLLRATNTNSATLKRRPSIIGLALYLCKRILDANATVAGWSAYSMASERTMEWEIEKRLAEIDAKKANAILIYPQDYDIPKPAKMGLLVRAGKAGAKFMKRYSGYKKYRRKLLKEVAVKLLEQGSTLLAVEQLLRVDHVTLWKWRYLEPKKRKPKRDYRALPPVPLNTAKTLKQQLQLEREKYGEPPIEPEEESTEYEDYE